MWRRYVEVRLFLDEHHSEEKRVEGEESGGDGGRIRAGVGGIVK